MQKLLTTFVILILSITIYSQSCLPDGITFDSQDSIDNFQLNHPGCVEIEGDVTITGSNIDNLLGLNVLTSFKGDLDIKNTSMLTDFIGLENITSIDGDLVTRNATNLTSFSGLSALISSIVSSSLRIIFRSAPNSLQYCTTL